MGPPFLFMSRVRASRTLCTFSGVRADDVSILASVKTRNTAGNSTMPPKTEVGRRAIGHGSWFTGEKCEDYNTARRRENELKRQKGGIGFFEKTGLDPALFGRAS